MARLEIFFPIIVTFFRLCASIDSAFYTDEKEIRTFSHSSEQQDVVKPVKSRSPIECILKCRVQLKESFYVEEDELNCYCLHNKNDKRALSSTTRKREKEGVFFNEHQPTPMKSCKDVQRKCPECVSGLYVLNLAEPTKVYCDMETDNGGWLLIGNLTVEDSSQATELYDTVVASDGKISALSKTPGGRFLLSNENLRTMSEYTEFKELRVRCFKPCHGRTAHIVLKGDYLMKYIFQGVVTRPITGPNEKLRFLSDDNSIASNNNNAANCGVLNWGGIYNHLLWSHNLFHFQLIKDRFECDDYFLSNGFKNSGDWQYYVR